ncbi:hypothetical protein Syun_026277 [Stephania yunnanensis]|uniref:Uncharacterized protein n=1 Tax=Stephania yunnanensis TaxID=152371 RepID=A0AAP0EW36_9MAGN
MRLKRGLWLVRVWERTHRSTSRILSIVTFSARSGDDQRNTRRQWPETGRDPVEWTDKDNDLVMHRDKDMDMIHLDRDFNVSIWSYGQSEGMSWVKNHSIRGTDGQSESLIYILADILQMVCSLLGGHGGAQLVMEEPSSSRRSPARHRRAQLIAEEPSPTEYGDAASHDRVCLALPRLCDPDPVAPAFGGLRLLGHLSILFPLTLISRCTSTVLQSHDHAFRIVFFLSA